MKSYPGLHNLWQPGSQAVRKWRENGKIKRKWRENEEIEWEWGNVERFTLTIFDNILTIFDNYWYIYEKVATVPESWVRWRAVFQSGSGVLKMCSEHFLIYIYGIQCDLMKNKLLKKLLFWKSLNSLYKSGSRSQKSPKRKAQKRLAQSRFIQIFE